MRALDVDVLVDDVTAEDGVVSLVAETIVKKRQDLSNKGEGRYAQREIRD